jgi:hypothetical protein
MDKGLGILSRGNMRKLLLLVLICIGMAHNIQAVSSEAGLALLQAAEEDDLKMAEKALNSGADIEARDNNGMTSLHRTTLLDSVSIAKLLLVKGADKEARDNNGRTPLSVASSWDSSGVVKLLFAYGANYKSRDNNGAIALNYTGGFEIEQILSSPNPYMHPEVLKKRREVVGVGNIKKHLLAREAGVRDWSRFKRKKKRDNLEPTPAESLLRNLPTRAK